MGPTNSFSLLVVEDGIAARNIMVQMIVKKYSGVTVYTANNGKEGLELFKQHNPPVVVTDINMPEMNGIEMAQAIRALNPNTGFLVLTAYGDEGSKNSFTELGFCSFLMKPLNFKELLSSIEKCVAESS